MTYTFLKLSFLIISLKIIHNSWKQVHQNISYFVKEDAKNYFFLKGKLISIGKKRIADENVRFYENCWKTFVVKKCKQASSA
jgi:hypothetical protein